MVQVHQHHAADRRNVRPDAVLGSTGERRELTSLRFLHLSDEQIPKRLEGWGCEAMCTTLGTRNRREPGPWAAHTIEGDVHDHFGALSEVAGRFLQVSWPLPNLSWLQAQSVYDGLCEGLGSMNFFIGRIDEVRNRSLCALRIGYGYVVEFVFRRATPKALGGDPHDLAAGLQCFIGHACMVAPFVKTFNR